MSTTLLSGRDRRTALLGMVVILMILVIGRGVPAVIAWQHEEVASAKELLDAAARASRLVSALPVIRDSLRARSARLAALDSASVPGDMAATAAAGLASIISNAADDAGVKADGLEPHVDVEAHTLGSSGKPRAIHAFFPVSVHGSVTGDAVGLAQFLADLEHGPTVLRVRSLSVTQPDPAAGSDRMEVLRADFTVMALARLTHNDYDTTRSRPIRVQSRGTLALAH
jgi:hypothetical protein